MIPTTTAPKPRVLDGHLARVIERGRLKRTTTTLAPKQQARPTEDTMAHWRTMMDNATMTAGDIAGKGDVTATIESVKAGSVKVQGGKQKKPLIKFKGFDLPYAANPTNCNTLTKMYGSETDAWVGKRATLYVAMVKAPDPDDRTKTVLTEAIRVRPAIPTCADVAHSGNIEPVPGRDPEADAATVRTICEAIDAATTEEEISKIIDPHRAALKDMGSKLISVVAGAKTQRIANLKAATEGDAP